MQILLVLIVLLALGGLSVNTKILPKFVTYYLSYFMWYPNKIVAKINKIKLNYDQIDDNVYIGSMPITLNDLYYLDNIDVNSIVSLNENWELHIESNKELLDKLDIEFFQYPSRDLIPPKMDAIILAVNQIITEIKKNKKVYIHCRAGRGRAATISICYLIQHKNMNPEEAYRYLKQKRSKILVYNNMHWDTINKFYVISEKSKNILSGDLKNENQESFNLEKKCV